MRLYRGVSKELDDLQGGKHLPKGSKKKVCPLMDGKWTFDGTFHHGYSAENGARAHQIETGLYDGCYVSASRSERVAIKFATFGFTVPGWIYVLDESVLASRSVDAIEFPDPLYPSEVEVSLASPDNGALPEGIIIEKYEVDSCGRRT
jgi:hypothetical protein